MNDKGRKEEATNENTNDKDDSMINQLRRELEVLKACIILRGGRSIPIEELRAMSLEDVLRICVRNNIRCFGLPEVKE
jgi:hypothetical protein